MNLNEQIGETIKRTINVGLSDDADAKKDGETSTGVLTLVFPATLTVGDLIDNLCGASSPRVKWQNNNRSKTADKREWSYVIKPVGRPVQMDPKTAIEMALAAMSPEDRAVYIAEMVERMGR